MIKAIFSMLILVIFVAPVQPQDNNVVKKEAEKLVREFLEVSGAVQSNRQVMDQMIKSFRVNMPQVPSSYWDELSKEINPDEVIDMIVPVYVEFLNINDLEQLIEFYKSPVGKKYAEKLPLISEKSVKIGQKWGWEFSQKIQSKLQQKGY